MGALANAVTLLRDDNFRRFITAACAYQARQVILEDPGTGDHAVRLSLAEKVMTNPNYIVDKAVAAVATDPAVATLGTTVGDTGSISEATILGEVANTWTALAKLDAGTL